MDSGSIIVGAILMVIGIIPFIFMHRNRKQSEQKLVQKVVDFANQHGFKVSQFDNWNSTVIAIDETAKVLFYTRKGRHEDAVMQFPLSDFRKCRIININRGVRKNDGQHNVIEKLQLALMGKHKDVETILDFYVAIVDGPGHSNEIKLSNKWFTLIGANLSIENATGSQKVLVNAK